MMDDRMKLKTVRQMYAAVLADTVRNFALEGVLEKVTERKKAEQSAGGAMRARQLGIERPEEAFTKTAELFECALWTIEPHGTGFTAKASGCMLSALAKRMDAPSPCEIFCLNPISGMIRGLDPDAEMVAEETLYQGSACRVRVMRGA